MMLAILAQLIATALEYVVDHPDLARKLLQDAKDVLGDNPAEHSPEALRGLAAGLAASRANAIQEYARRKAGGGYTPYST